MKQRRNTPEFSISFLDVICCGFGAVILLLMITKTVQPQILERSEIIADGAVKKLLLQREDMRGETKILNREMKVKREQISSYTDQIAILQRAVDAKSAVYDRLSNKKEEEYLAAEELNRLKQELSEQQRRLSETVSKVNNELVGGIPVDSEYIVFVVDTSGSMTGNWERVARQLLNAVDSYPAGVKGIQVLNGEGVHMLPSSIGQWIPGTQLKNSSFVKSLLGFQNASDTSKLVPGIRKAATTYYRSDEKVSIYVFADDLMGRGVRTDEILRLIRGINERSDDGSTRMRIHVIAFPFGLEFANSAIGATVLGLKDQLIRFGNFARNLAAQNDGAFVGLVQ